MVRGLTAGGRRIRTFSSARYWPGNSSSVTPWSEPPERGQTPGFLQIADGPQVAHASDYPLQDGPEVVVDDALIDEFERIHVGVGLDP